MLTLLPCRDDRKAADDLATLVTDPAPEPFAGTLRDMDACFSRWRDTATLPLPAPGLIITPEMRRQSEMYLPVHRVAAAFARLYRAALTYPPILTSTCFHKALSWVDVFAALPRCFQRSANPARLLANLLDDAGLLRQFICASFLPDRFYGGFGRYPQQRSWLKDWLAERACRPLRCLDAACGIGEESYGLALLMMELGWSPEQFFIEGWTLEPLEVWASAYGRFPHDMAREAAFRLKTEPVMNSGAATRLYFVSMDLRQPQPEAVQYDIVLCNGLLGGPVLHGKEELQQVVANLSGLLAPGGVLLAADSFHGGWSRQWPQAELQALFRLAGLETFSVEEGLGCRRVNSVHSPV